MNKNSMNLIELARELQRQAEVRRDFVADTRNITITPGVKLSLDGGNGSFNITRHTHGQLAQWSGIGSRYYNLMKEKAPELLAENLNHWLHDGEPATRMIRTLDGDARAFLSNSYRRVDNDFIANTALSELLNNSGSISEIKSVAVTENRLYIQATFPRIEGDVRRGDVVQGGMIISNSEIGSGSVQVLPFVYRLVCENGMVAADKRVKEGRFRKNHIGRRIEAQVENYYIYSDEALRADDEALSLKVRDSIRALADGKWFKQMLNRLREASEGQGIANPIAGVEELAQQYALRQAERDNVLTSLISQGDYSRYGLLNAITATANVVSDYDRAVELEELGGKILTLNQSQWRSIAEANTDCVLDEVETV